MWLRMDFHGHASRILSLKAIGGKCVIFRVFWILVILAAILGATYFNITFIMEFLNTTTLISVKV